MVRTFKITEKDVGKTFTVRFLPDITDVCNNIISITPKSEPETNRYICFAVINGTFKVFNFGHGVYREIDNRMFLSL